MRLGMLRADLLREAGRTDAAGLTLGAAFEQVMTECVIPNVAFEMEDEFTGILQERGTRAALAP